MSKFEKNMEEIFDITPSGDVVAFSNKKENLPAKESSLEEDLSDAYQQSKQNLEGIIEQGAEAMNSILVIAKEGQHPRAYEVYSGLLKNIVDANKELLNIQKQIRDMDTKKEINNTNIEKAVFIGSTEELSKMLKDMKKNGN